jgi:hypothetical protein
MNLISTFEIKFSQNRLICQFSETCKDLELFNPEKLVNMVLR